MMHPKQREWDALIILHWRRDNRFGQLAEHCKQLLGDYPYALSKEGLIRSTGFTHPKTHVRVWVDTYLHPLGVKLWEVEDNKRVLDWLNASTGLDCERSKKATKWQRESNGTDRRAKLHVQQLSLSIDIGKLNGRMTSFNQVKATGRKSGRK